MSQENAFRYCPYDGTRLVPLGGEGLGPSGKCPKPECGFVDYQNPKPCVGVIVEKDGEVLLARRAVEPAKGMWDLPGGFIDNGETAEQAAVREIREETGLVLKNLRFLCSVPDTYGSKNVPTLNLIFTATVASGDTHADSDVEELQWFTVDELPAHLAFEHQQEALRQYRSVPKALPGRSLDST